MPLAAVPDRKQEVDPLMSVTGALVEANDRLLGLIALTGVEATSLDELASVRALVDKARVILAADVATISGAVDYTAGASPIVGLNSMTTHGHVGDGEAFELSFFRNDPFGTPDTKLLDAVGNVVANTIRTARMHQAALAQAVVVREHEAAARITSAALPDPTLLPEIDGLSMYASMSPARNTGGDLYTWSELGGKLWFVIGDVSGKGLPAAVLMTTVVNAVDGALRRHHGAGIERVIGSIDRWAFQPLSDSAMFVTLALGCFTPGNNGEPGSIDFVNAGHSPIVLNSGGTVTRLEATAPPIGVIEAALPQVQTLAIKNRDLLVLATDGFTEQENISAEAFGEDRFDREIAAFPTESSASTVGASLVQLLDEHACGQEQSDDRTLMVLRFGQ